MPDTPPSTPDNAAPFRAERLLFVCLGNICRSPTAEGVFGAIAREAGLPLEIDSAGTGNWHVGAPPDRRAIAAAAARGYDISSLRARQVTAADFSRFDLILAMDSRNRADLERLRPGGAATPVEMFLSYDAQSGGFLDLPDPYFDDRFDDVLDMIERASRGLAARLLR